jgi:hypothetical protein
MVIAVEEGANEGESCVSYVDFLARKSLVPPKAQKTLDRVRHLGNEANHKIAPATLDDSKLILSFLAAVLQLNFQYADNPE